MGQQFNSQLSLGVEQFTVAPLRKDAIYTIEGVRLDREPAHGIYIKGGRKYVR